MSSTLTAVTDAPNKRVTLTATDLPAGPARIWRTDANGRRLVRVPLESAAGRSLTVTDYEAALTGALDYELEGQRTNLVANGSFETDTAGWSSQQGTIARAGRPGSAFHGGYVLRFTSNNAATAGTVYQTGAAFPSVVPGSTVTASAYLLPQVTTSFRLILAWADANGAFLGTSATSGNKGCTNVGWTRVSFSAVVPANAHKVQLQIQAYEAAAVGVWWDVDGVLLEQTTSVQPYIDGTAPQTIAANAGPINWTTPGAYVRPAADPAWGEAGPLVLIGRDMTVDTGANLHKLLDRSDQVDTGSANGLRAGTLEFLVDSWAEAFALEQLVVSRDSYELQGGAPIVRRTIMLRQIDHEGMDGLYIVERVRVARDPNNFRPIKWHVSLDVTETATGPYLQA